MNKKLAFFVPGFGIKAVVASKVWAGIITNVANLSDFSVRAPKRRVTSRWEHSDAGEKKALTVGKTGDDPAAFLKFQCAFSQRRKEILFIGNFVVGGTKAFDCQYSPAHALADDNILNAVDDSFGVENRD